jgi:pentatricopeptide repeat protein
MAARGQHEEALKLLRSLKARGLGPTSYHYHKSILACKPAKQWSQAVALLEEMLESKVRARAFLWYRA